MYINPQFLVDPKTIIRAAVILKSHSDYFATKVQHKAEKGDNAATILITERELEMFKLTRIINRFQPNEPDVWSLSASDINQNKFGKYNLMSYLINKTNNYFRHDIEATEDFVRKFFRMIILYRLETFRQDEQEKLLKTLLYLKPTELQLNKEIRDKLIQERTQSFETKIHYVAEYLEEFVKQGYITEKELSQAIKQKVNKVKHIWDSISAHFHKQEPQTANSEDVLRKQEIDHRNYLSNLFKTNLFQMMSSYYASLYPEDKNKAKIITYLKFNKYWKLAQAIQRILSKRITDRWKVPSGEEIVTKIAYESLYRLGSPVLLLNYHSELNTREKEFRTQFDFAFPAKLKTFFRNQIYPSVYEEIRNNKNDPFIQILLGDIEKALLKVFLKLEDLHCLNFTLGISKKIVTHQRKLILTLLDVYKAEHEPTYQQIVVILQDKVLFPPAKILKFTNCKEQDLNSSDKRSYGIVKKFYNSHPEYYSLIQRIETLYTNVFKLEAEMMRNIYLDVKDIRPTKLDSKEVQKRRKILDNTYQQYVNQKSKTGATK